MTANETSPLGSECNAELGPALEDAADKCLSALSGVDTHDVNLRDRPKAWAAIEEFAAKVQAAERERWTEAVMAELDGNGQAQAIVAYATRA